MSAVWTPRGQSVVGRVLRHVVGEPPLQGPARPTPSGGRPGAAQTGAACARRAGTRGLEISV